MRVHITLPEEVVREIDRRAGGRGRSAFIARAVVQALDDERRWALIERSIGALPAEGHDWDADPAEWVRLQRRLDAARVG